MPGQGPTFVTLAVSVEQAQELAFAQESGVLTFALRPVAEEGSHDAMPPPTTVRSITRGNEELIPMQRRFREYRGRR